MFMKTGWTRPTALKPLNGRSRDPARLGERSSLDCLKSLFTSVAELLRLSGMTVQAEMCCAYGLFTW